MTLKIEYVQINTIKPYDNNAKEHTQEQINQIIKSIEQFGNIDPIGIWNNEIVEGHGRYLALLQMDVQEIPVIRMDHLSEDQRRAYALVHNKLTMNTGFDLDKLNEELENLTAFDFEDFGFEIDVNDFEPIDDVNSKLENYDHMLKIDRTKIVITEEEYQGIMQRYNDYVSENGVAFGFVRSLLND